MVRRTERISTIGPLRIIRAIGGLLVLLAAIRLLPIEAMSIPLSERLVDAFLLGGPGTALLYASVWLPRSQLRSDVFPRITKWCLGGVAGMLGVVGLMLFNPGGSTDEPFWAMAVAGSLGAMGGLAIGIYNGQALSRAREAEEHRDRYRTERDFRQRIFDTSPVGVSVIGTDGSVQNVNHRATEVFGTTEEELLERDYNDVFVDATDTDEIPPSDGVVQQVLRTGEPVYEIERQITRPDGRQIWLLLNAAPLHEASGTITAVIIGFEDITDRKQLEEELKQTVDRLEQSNDRLRQFAYAASHDLQEPLRMVSSYLLLLDNKYKDDLDSDAQEYIKFAVDGADRMRTMIEDLLAYSRIDQKDPEFDQVDCNTVLTRIESDLQVQIAEADAEIVTESLPTVVADEKQLEQLFQNLVSNAIKYRDDDPPRITITAEEQGDLWKFSVDDNGIGIDPEHADRIFEVFKRLHNDETYQGTGVGLSLCQKIVARHGGRIWVDSQLGEGSTFYFTLPKKSPPHQDIVI